jgi:hypothetical protein
LLCLLHYIAIQMFQIATSSDCNSLFCVLHYLCTPPFGPSLTGNALCLLYILWKIAPNTISADGKQNGTCGDIAFRASKERIMLLLVTDHAGWHIKHTAGNKTTNGIASELMCPADITVCLNETLVTHILEIAGWIIYQDTGHCDRLLVENSW